MPARKIANQDASDQEDTQPSRARRALLTGGALGLAAVAGSTLGRVQPASANETQPVTAILPSNDKSGQTDTPAINSAIQAASPGGIVVLAGGAGISFYINASIIPMGGVLLLGEKGTVITAASGMSEPMISVSSAVGPPSTLACFTLDGGNGSSPWATGGSQASEFDGINISAQFLRFLLSDITIQNVSRDGINIVSGAGSQGGANAYGLQILNCQRHGINSTCSDVRWQQVEVGLVGQYSYLVAGTQQDFCECKSNRAGLQGSTTVTSGSAGTLNVNNALASYWPTSGTLQITKSSGSAYQVPYTNVTTSGSPPMVTAFTGCTFGSYSPASGDTVGLLQTAVDGSGTADSWHLTGAANSVRAVAQNNLYGNAVYLGSGANNCRVDVQAGNAGNALLALDGANRNLIDVTMAHWSNWVNASGGGPPSYVYALNGSNSGNVVRIAGGNPGANSPNYGNAYSALVGGATETGNYFGLECENPGALQNVTYASTITPDPYLGGTINCNLGGTITIGNTADTPGQPAGHIGSEMIISLKQPSAGGAAVHWGSAYTVTTAVNTAANARTTWRFKCLSYSGGLPQWVEIG